MTPATVPMYVTGHGGLFRTDFAIGHMEGLKR